MVVIAVGAAPYFQRRWRLPATDAGHSFDRPLPPSQSSSALSLHRQWWPPAATTASVHPMRLPLPSLPLLRFPISCSPRPHWRRHLYVAADVRPISRPIEPTSTADQATEGRGGKACV